MDETLKEKKNKTTQYKILSLRELIELPRNCRKNKKILIDVSGNN